MGTTTTPAVVTAPEAAAAEKRAAVEGASSVADAVKKVADAAVEAASKAKTAGPPPEITVTANAKGKFVIRGSGLGKSGTVKFGPHQANTVEWGPEYIAGQTPGGLSGETEVVVHVDDRTSKKATIVL
ncbi:MAG TPA: IPT/TIG domain-containing protein [Sphingomicrobium sp.]|jgi:hypothetical protein|nr:IPT/TIG domain-containing protein [Sphingomicrobium sp.]